MILDELEIGSNRIDPPRLPRPMLSTLDTWDMHAVLDYPFNAAMRGNRVGWNVPSIAVTSETVNTVRSSAPTRFVSPAVPTKTPMLADKTTGVGFWQPMPNMAQSIRSDSDVQISFSASVSAAPAGHAPYFAIFRDGRQISQVYRSSGPSAFLISGAYVDTAAPKGLHVYDLRWKVDPTVTGGTITAVQKNRTFQASNLRAQ